jgi:hypothetical protein
MIVQFMDLDPVPEAFSKPMATVKGAKVFNELPQNIALPPSVDYGANRADVFRFYWLANNPDDVYLDADVEVVRSFIPPNDGKPWFSAHKVPDRKVDTWAIFGNGCKDFFTVCWNRYAAYLQLIDSGSKLQFSMFMITYLQHLPPGSFNTIPGGYFKHHELRTWSKR